MDDYENLSHSKWECKYDGVFIPKYRRKTLYGELRQHLGEVFRRLAIQKESWVEEGHLMPDHVHMMISIQRPHRAALSGPKPKAPGFAGGYLPSSSASRGPWQSASYQQAHPRIQRRRPVLSLHD